MSIQSPQQKIQELHQDIEILIERLTSILERVELYEEAAPSVASRTEPAGPASEEAKAGPGKDVFIVHGHAGKEDAVARHVEKLSLKAVILKEQLHGGASTLIEKLEREAASCGYAIVVYTGDDVGRAVTSDSLSLRARENVVLELGYFIGRLGRDRVTILHDEAVAVPSDFHGVGYYPLDNEGAWKAKVEGELKRARLL